AVRFLPQLLIRPLRVGGEAVEAARQRVADLGQGLLEYLVLTVVHLAQGDHFLAQSIDGRGAQGIVIARRGGRFDRGWAWREVVAHEAVSFKPKYRFRDCLAASLGRARSPKARG